MHETNAKTELLNDLERAYRGDAWHGPSLAVQLWEVDAASAAAVPIPGAHSIWEITLHSMAWTREVARRLRVGHPAMPAEGDWPPVPEPTPEAWARALLAFDAAHREVIQAVEAFADERLDDQVGVSRDAPLGAGVTYRATLAGLAQHHAYHGGQVAVLRRALGILAPPEAQTAISVPPEALAGAATPAPVVEVSAVEALAKPPVIAPFEEPAVLEGPPPREEREAESGPRPVPFDEPALPDEQSTLEASFGRSTIRAIPQHPVAITDATFTSLGLAPSLLRVLARIGFQHPTPIQAAVIPPALEGRDIIGLAQTGSGKTAAFCLPLAERLTHGKGVRGLILSPTREIALQTKAFLDLFGEDHRLDNVCLIGGVRMGPQIDGLRRRPDVVVATPGRLLDHVRRGTLSLARVEELVLDEADHMLDLGFLPQIQEVLAALPVKRRTMMFSATMPEPIGRLVSRLMTDPVRIDLMPGGRTAEGITHRVYMVGPEDKKACLLSLLNLELGSTLVFIRRKIDAEWICKVLEKEGHPVERIHSDLSQGKRVEALQGFREGQHRILVATDIAARGIDIPRIEHIVNYDLPETVEDYIHRSGRTARGRLLGIVSSICTWQDKPMIRELEATLGQTIARCTVPGVEPWEEMKVRQMSPRGRLPVRRRL